MGESNLCGLSRPNNWYVIGLITFMCLFISACPVNHIQTLAVAIHVLLYIGGQYYVETLNKQDI